MMPPNEIIEEIFQWTGRCPHCGAELVSIYANIVYQCSNERCRPPEEVDLGYDSYSLEAAQAL